MQSFDALMALASKQTEASQLALAKENQLRQAREKAKRLEEERKEKDRLRFEKERLARQKLEDQKREQQLQQDRLKRQAERAAAAELSRKQDEANRQSSSKSSKSTASPRHRPTGRPSASASLISSKDPEEQRQLERQEKEAKALAKLFGEPVSALKKPASPRPTSNGQRSVGVKKGKASVSSALSRNLSSSSTPITARQRIEQQFSISERKPLNQTKRDRRTIEEIERDMKQKKGFPEAKPSFLEKLATRDASSDSRFAPKKTIIPLKPIASGSTLPVQQTTRVAPGTPIKRKAASPSSGLPPKRNQPLKTFSRTNGASNSSQTAGPSGSTSRLQNVTRSEDEDEEDEYEEDSAVEVEAVSPAIRDEIWKIMGKDRKQYATKTIFSDEEESDDMEADVDDVLEEEGRAARLARLEDQREQKALRRHELEKKKRLSQNRMSK